MIYRGFKIHAFTRVHDAYCSCGKELKSVSSGLLGEAFFCIKCESVYELRLVKCRKDKISERFLEQARSEIKKGAIP